MKTGGNVRRMHNIPLRLLDIVGYDKRMNDVVYHPPTIQSDGTTVFFGGDVQNFRENMEPHESNSKYIQWNLENTATLLNKSIPNSHIIIIRPSRMEHETFSCFNNFVPSMKYGVPDHVPTHQAIHHLTALLQNLSEKISLHKLQDTAAPSMESGNSANKYPTTLDNNQPIHISKNLCDLNLNTIRLIGFSKGCVVLNQFLHEFHHFKTQTPNDEIAANLIAKIQEMYWLDGGHSGVKNTWITSPDILKCYAGLGIRTHIHVTPYQVEDPKRPWIKQEENDFYNILYKFGVDIERELHFSDVIPNLDEHFNVLKVFKRS